MKQRNDFHTIAKSIASAFLWGVIIAIVVNILCLVIAELLIHQRNTPTNTTQHQPEPTEQYADSLVCPD